MSFKVKLIWITPQEILMQTKKTLKMKNSIFIVVSAIIISSCGGGSGEITEIGSLISKKDSLKEIKDGLSAQIAELEIQISAMDTTKSITLVTTKLANISDFKHYFQVYGSVQTDQNAQIYSELAGKILDIKVQEGDQINKGQTIALIDISVLRQQEDELKTRLELAETTFQKQKKLWDKKIGSEMQFLQAKNNRDALQRNLETLQAQMAMGNVKAPFSGVIDEVFPKKGEMAMPGFPIARLINLEKVYVKADVSENYLGKVKQGDKVKVALPSLGIEKISQIQRTGQYINPANRTFKIKTLVENSDKVLKPNMVALLEIEDFTRDSVVVIPSELLLQGSGGKEYVYVVENENGVSVAKKTVVKVGMTYKDKSFISEGLSGNEILVDKGARSIRNGEQIDIKN